MRVPRVAYLPDSFHEINGVAHTSRNFVAYAERHALPFLCIRAGTRPHTFEQVTELRTLELRRSRAAVRIEKDLQFDPLFFRHTSVIRRELLRFKPDLIHITGPSELGIFGAYFAWEQKIPLAASWHTNVHEYAARRLDWLTRRISKPAAASLEQRVEASSLWATTRFYSLARVLYAPNEELCRMLEQATHRPCHLMQRGVDTVQFSPEHRTRSIDDSTLVLGYVGRLSVEKNVALLARLERGLLDLGISNFRFLIVGHGNEQAGLRASLTRADFPGVLRGAELSRAYADMDLFVFPSHTDTFGNVVLEALSSGVPAVVTPGGGPKYIVRDQETGFVTSDEGFVPAIAALAENRTRLAQMRTAARAYALACSWDAVFDRVYEGYRDALPAL
ncbi:glycosyltransferase [Edaphobacter modestus]|uniref:Glycosyltransferase involved in cell wall biosynthesis n=1 Tax=Edaphobacter modestus TaxID=388466 RepID=A0A4Q7YUY0_9BACT|nr:glycosyltransferase [Edaphobacter modestus]RZU41438.1 glycosyltransferase involved in cell wall biosynthesis [Edaphobacter modestus]